MLKAITVDQALEFAYTWEKGRLGTFLAAHMGYGRVPLVKNLVSRDEDALDRAETICDFMDACSAELRAWLDGAERQTSLPLKERHDAREPAPKGKVGRPKKVDKPVETPVFVQPPKAPPAPAPQQLQPSDFPQRAPLAGLGQHARAEVQEEVSEEWDDTPLSEEPEVRTVPGPRLGAPHAVSPQPLMGERRRRG